MEKKHYTPEERAALAEKAAANAGEHFRHGLNCSECVLKGFLELGLTDYPPETVALVSGMGGGMGGTGHLCGAVNAGMLAISSMHGRRDPYAKATMEERIDELHHPETGIYPRHAAYVRAVLGRSAPSTAATSARPMPITILRNASATARRSS